jgi:ribosome assembly protein YihI (activator of Der GTPase)
LDFETIIQEFENQLSMDCSLKVLISEILYRIDVLMEQIGAVKGLVHFKEYLEEVNES